MIKVIVKAEVRVTEDINKVERAIRNVFNPVNILITEEDNKRFIVAEGEGLNCLQKLRSLLRNERILDAARSIFKKSIEGKTLKFHINKQIAHIGRLSFSAPEHESPLGPITFIITCSSPEKLVDWLAPPTSNGKPLYELEDADVESV
jgi:predicted RNA binding protein with dsRBD fold (UPF0201 family)